MDRREIIQILINKTNAKSYLEIGLGEGEVFLSIVCENKFGVDPQFGNHEYQKGSLCKLEPTHPMTSDEFFKQNKEYFGVIFIDGRHEADYVERDINNAIDCLSDGGYIVCHDINPLSLKAQLVPRIQNKWNGDCWKAWVKLRSTRKNLTMYVVGTDHGCGVIQKGNQKLLDLQGLEITYENLEKNRKKWLNLISVSEFNAKLRSLK